MGLPLSPIIADLTILQLETTVINSLDFNIPLYIRYVDDILLFLPQDQIDSTFSTFVDVVLHNETFRECAFQFELV